MSVPIEHNSTFIENLKTLRDNCIVVYILIDSVFIFLMLVGFACLEAGGSIHSKNTTNLMLMKLGNLFISGYAFYFVGFPLAFGNNDDFFPHDYLLTAFRGSYYKILCLECIPYVVISNSIISGAVAERCQFIGFIIFTAAVAGVTLPINFSWTQSDNGFLKRMGYVDLVGSGSVHAFSGACSFVAAWMIGPRRGRFLNDKVVDMPGHSMPMMGLGALLLVTGTLAFNRDANVLLDQKGSVGVLAGSMICTILGGSGAAILSLFLTRYWFTKGYWPITFIIYATLAGLASTSAAPTVLRGWEAFVIGLIACISYAGCHYLVLFIQVDDVVDSTAIHFGGGFTGIVLSPFFGNEGFFANPNSETLLVVASNIIGVTVIVAWATLSSIFIFGLLRVGGLLRVNDRTEVEGLDVIAHGEKSYDPQAWNWGRLLQPENVR